MRQLGKTLEDKDFINKIIKEESAASESFDYNGYSGFFINILRERTGFWWGKIPYSYINEEANGI